MNLTSGRIGESFAAFESIFPDDPACRRYLFDLRYGAGTTCPACGRSAAWKPRPQRPTFMSSCCRFEMSPTSGTFLSSIKVPLKLFLYSLLLTSILDGKLSTAFLSKHLGISLPAALRVTGKIRAQMCLLGHQSASRYSGKVYVDEMMIRNLSQGTARHLRGTIVLGITDGVRPSFYCIRNRKASTLSEVIRSAVAPGTEIVVDGYASYDGLTRQGYRLSRVIHSRGLWKNENGDSSAYIENCWREVRQRIENVHQRVDTNYLWSYLGQLSFILHCRTIGRSPFWSALERFPAHTPETLAIAKKAIDLR